MSHLSTDTASLERELAALRDKVAEQSHIISELRGQDALKTQFLANVAHDLRTPLTAIITHAEILRDGLLGALSDRQNESVTGIINGGRQLLPMVAEILTYSRAAANQLTVTRSTFTMSQVIDQVCMLSEALAARKGHSLSIDVDESLPALQADREKTAHVLGNLLGNAINFTPPGGRIWVRAAPRVADDQESAALVEVGDNGIGIAPEHHEMIFREFAQVDASASRRHHGTGLGLAIARHFVELQGGRIWLDSALGEGSRFYFTIPVRPAQDA